MPFLTEELERILRDNCEPDLEIVSGRRRSDLEGSFCSRKGGFTITGGTGVACKSSYGHDYYGGGINAMFIVRPDNFKTMPKEKDACGCQLRHPEA